MKKLALATALALAAFPFPSFAWDAAGHMLVDQIAYNKVRPATRDAVNQLVSKLDDTYNEKQPYNFITAGAWMDDMRAMPKYAWSAWHYVNMPYTFSGTPVTEPPPPHVIWAIGEAVKTLKDHGAPLEKHAEALGMLMHLVGDIHQPLHCTDWDNDKGGNGVLIYGVPFSDLGPGSIPNLHTYWDKAFRFEGRDGKVVETFSSPVIAARPKGDVPGVIQEQAAKIMAEFPPESLYQLHTNSDEHTWALESHIIGCLAAYPNPAKAAETEVITIPADFATKSRAIAAQRIALAGYRLGRLLDEIFAR